MVDYLDNYLYYHLLNIIIIFNTNYYCIWQQIELQILINYFSTVPRIESFSSFHHAVSHSSFSFSSVPLLSTSLPLSLQSPDVPMKKVEWKTNIKINKTERLYDWNIKTKEEKWKEENDDVITIKVW